MTLRVIAADDTGPRNILLTRLSAIGDCILTLPLAVDVKRLWPNSRLTWVVDCAAESLLRDHAAIDNVIRIEKRWIKNPANWRSLREKLHSESFDLVLDPQGLTKSAALGWLSGARQRVGMDYSHGREVAPLIANTRVHRCTRHMVDTYRELLSPWTTVTEGAGQFEYPCYEAAAQSASDILSCVGINTVIGERFAALNPGAGWDTKLWPVQRFAQLARELKQTQGLKSLIFWAGDSERLMAEVIEENSRGSAIAAPQTDLRELSELIRKAAVLVTGDTSALHIASAVNTPCVALHGVTWADETGPYGNSHIAIQSPVTPKSNKTNRRGTNTAMQAIEVDDVLRGCTDLLSRNSMRQAA